MSSQAAVLTINLGSLRIPICTGTHYALKAFCETLFVLLDGHGSIGLSHMTGALVLAGPATGLQLAVLPQLLSASSHLAHSRGLLQRKDGRMGGSCLISSPARNLMYRKYFMSRKPLRIGAWVLTGDLTSGPLSWGQTHAPDSQRHRCLVLTV